MTRGSPAFAAQGELPDVRDGLTRTQRVILWVLHRTEQELHGRPVPSAMLYGRVIEHLDLSVHDFERLLAELIEGRSEAAPVEPEGERESPSTAAPPQGTIERWAYDYITTTDLGHKRAPPPPPRVWEANPPPRRINHPGRPAELRITAHASKTPGPRALEAPEKRAPLVHTFLHHELQAAELMCWAILAFPDTPEAFRAGLLGIARDEIRHLVMYEDHLATLGHAFGDYPVRDWFWERVPRSPGPAEFVAAMGVGFEGANLDHTMRFAERFRAAGDEAGAALIARVGAEEISHVRFGITWFRRFLEPQTSSLDFTVWASHLPPPLSPTVMRGAPLDRAARLSAGFSEPFLDELTRWSFTPRAPGS